MEMKLKPFDFAQAAARAGMAQVAERVRQASGAPEAGAVAGPSFHTAFSQALQSVSAAQAEASRMQQQVQLGAPGASIEATMVAMQKAQIGFQATLQVRNKLVQAYTDIMNMQV